MHPQLEEYKKAIEEKRQPICVHCSEPLNKITQYLMDWVEWVWDETLKEYIKSNGTGDSEKPMCDNCQSHDWDFIEGSHEAIQLGLTY